MNPVIPIVYWTFAVLGTPVMTGFVWAYLKKETLGSEEMACYVFAWIWGCLFSITGPIGIVMSWVMLDTFKCGWINPFKRATSKSP